MRRCHAGQQRARVAGCPSQRMELCECRDSGVVLVLSWLIKPARGELENAFLTFGKLGVVRVVTGVAMVHSERDILIELGLALAVPGPRNCTVFKFFAEQDAVLSFRLDALHRHIFIPAGQLRRPLGVAPIPSTVAVGV